MANQMTADLAIARRAQSRGRYNASDDSELVSVELDGAYHLRAVELSKKVSLKKSEREELEAALVEAVNKAVDKARRKAEARLEKALSAPREGARH